MRCFNIRKHGSMIYIDLTITVDKDLSLYESHLIAHKVEKTLLNNFNNIKGINVHYEGEMKHIS